MTNFRQDITRSGPVPGESKEFTNLAKWQRKRWREVLHEMTAMEKDKGMVAKQLGMIVCIACGGSGRGDTHPRLPIRLACRACEGVGWAIGSVGSNG